jgi:hypothetical protein
MVLVGYLAVIHFPNSFGGLIRFSILLSTRSSPGIVDIAVGCAYIGAIAGSW